MRDFIIIVSSSDIVFNEDLKRAIVKAARETIAAKTGKTFLLETDEIIDIDFYDYSDDGGDDDECGEGEK